MQARTHARTPARRQRNASSEQKQLETYTHANLKPQTLNPKLQLLPLIVFASTSVLMKFVFAILAEPFFPSYWTEFIRVQHAARIVGAYLLSSFCEHAHTYIFTFVL
jgi:hypothetical protein